MKKKISNLVFLSSVILGFFASSQAFALNPILRDFHSVRAAGMGDVRYSTGIFEENFYANPARSTDNPENLFQLPQISFEASGATLGALNSLLKSGSNGLQAFSDNVGKPLSQRFQFVFPGYYNRHFITDAWSFGVGLTVSEQVIAQVSNSGNIDPTVVLAAGPVFNLARRFLEEDRLSVGINVHTEVRGNSKSYSVEQYLAGEPIANVVKGGNGMGYDADLGTTFKPHWALGEFKYEVAFAINNVLGGKYDNLGHPIKSWSGDPFASNRSYNLGVSGLHDHFWFFSSILLSLELTDLGNNGDGSIYRCVHMGSEFKWKLLAARLGISQGYMTAGFGIDLGFFNANVATYSEELGLNPGVMEDRRYAAQIGFEI